MSFNTFAIGETNIDGGGGNLNDSISGYYWSGADGVRVTVIKESTKTAVIVPIDFTNYKPNDIKIHFVKASKLQYKNGYVLTPSTNKYIYNNPEQKIPKIVGTNGTANIPAIKSYFTDERIIRSISNISGFNYSTLTNGSYKLLIEPIAYFQVAGAMAAMTAHEAALYDQKANGILRRYNPSLTYKNLPLSLFLETSDLGFPAWSGSTTQKVSNSQIISVLGLGVVRFGPADPPVDMDANDYEYRLNTDVISAITLNAAEDILPQNPIKVTFNIKGSNYTVTDIVIPEGQSQVVWVKWHTPAIPQNVTITATVSGNGASFGNGTSSKTFTAKIVDLKEKAPPNPTANDDKPAGYKIPTVMPKINKTSASWGVWSCYWKANWQWEANWKWVVDKWIDYGKWVDKGNWEYKWTGYQANLAASMQVNPDTKVPTSAGKTMKSGYGINLNVSTALSSNAPASAITGAQNVLSYYPEFGYKTYFRLSDMVVSGYNAQFKLVPNEYSTYGTRTHFTPLWFPDGIYEPTASVLDVWTPAGMLTCGLSDYVNIKGNVYDDWHIAPQLN